MKVLIIGGTRFLGRAIVDAALEAGHTLVSRTMNGEMVFNRKGKPPCWRNGTNHIELVLEISDKPAYFGYNNCPT